MTVKRINFWLHNETRDWDSKYQLFKAEGSAEKEKRVVPSES